MSLAIIAPGKDRQPWLDAIASLMPELKVQVYPDITDPGFVKGAVLWKYPYGILSEFPNLEWVTSLGAGVDYILADPELPTSVKLTRIVDPNLASDMKRTAALAVLSIDNRMREYSVQQVSSLWKPLPRHSIKNIGILGMGEMGRAIASGLRELGFYVEGLSRKGEPLEGFKVYPIDLLCEEFAGNADLIISVLPLTDSTRGIINRDLFSAMKKGSWIVNLGRGDQLVEKDLLAALDSGHLGGAWLDVFTKEPLPADHPFWNRNDVIITPHIASVTDPLSASEVVVDNYRRLVSGRELLYSVDRNLGY